MKAHLVGFAGVANYFRARINVLNSNAAFRSLLRDFC
jgi:hypothetical protein